MHPYDICPELFHLLKIARQFVPIVVPEILDQRSIITVVESPWMEWRLRTGCDEPVAVRCHSNALQRRGRMQKARKQHQESNGAHAYFGSAGARGRAMVRRGLDLENAAG